MECVYFSFLLLMCVLGHIHGAQRVAVRDLLRQHTLRKRQLTSDEHAVTSYHLEKEASHLTRRELDDAMGLDDDTSLSEVTSDYTVQGTQITKEKETYKGIVIPEGMVTIETDEDGRILDASGHVYKHIDLVLDGIISRDVALEICKRYQGDQDSTGDDISHVKIETQIQFEENVRGDNEVTPYPVHLVQYLVVRNDAERRPSCFLDARDGTVLAAWDALDSYDDCCQAEGTGGNVMIGKIHYGKLQRCLDVQQVNGTCYLQNHFVKIISNNFTESESGVEEVASYNCKESEDGINGAYSPMLDALFYGTVIVRMYQDWYGYDLSPLTLPLTFRVHFGVNVSNAYWNGESCQFGDGGEDFHPLVSLDIAGHEVAHGVTEMNSKLMYFDQWGALNEAFSDMAGYAAEAYLGEANWLMGVEVSKEGVPLRFLNNPVADHSSIDHIDNFTSTIDVHYSSGIYNKVFYNLIGELGLPIKEVFHVFLHANRLYWHNMATFASASCDVLKAAYDLGLNGQFFRKAFREVGIDLEDCDVNHHVVKLRHDVWRHNITVSKTVSPFFVLGVPARFAANYSIYANSSEGDVIITVSNKNWAGKKDCEVFIFARETNQVEVKIPAKSSEFHVSIELSTNSSNELTDVSIMATFGCIEEANLELDLNIEEELTSGKLWYAYCYQKVASTTVVDTNITTAFTTSNTPESSSTSTTQQYDYLDNNE